MIYRSRIWPSALRRFALGAAIAMLISGAAHSTLASDRALASDRPADLVLRNGAVYTVDASRSWASSVAVAGGRIQFVGDDTEIASYIGPDTQVIDLAGRMLLPGFQDSHVHPQSAAHSQTRVLRLDDIHDIETARERIRAYARAHSELTWIEGAGLDEDMFVAAVDNPRKFLDELVPDRPIVITSMLIFTSWANSKAFEAGGITADTPDPPNGTIVRDPATGQPTGAFLNRAIALVDRYQPKPSPEEVLADYGYALSKYSSHGVTAIMEASANPASSGTAYGDLASANKLKHRVRMCFAHSSTAGDDKKQISDFVIAREKIRQRFPDGQVRADCVKLFLDGDVLVHGGALLEDYADRPGFRGKPDFEYARLEKLVTDLAAEGFQIKAHSIGSRSAREFIDAVEAAQKTARKPRDLRHHLTHAEVLHTTDILRMRELGMPVEVTPMAPLPPIGPGFPKVLGRERATTIAHSYNSFMQNGLVVVFGNDWMGADTVVAYESLSQPANIEVAVTRRKPGDISLDTAKYGIINEHEKIALPAAIAAYTIKGAYLTHDEADSGSIEVGKHADFVVLDKNLFDMPVHEIHTVNVDITIFNGEVVYERK